MFRSLSHRPALAGIAFMCLGIALFSINDVLGKWLVGSYGVAQMLLFRSVAALIVLIPAIRREGLRQVAHAPRPWLQLLRVTLSTLEVAFFYWAVASMSLAAATTFYLAGPIYVAVMARLFLGEEVPLRRWLAIGFGFAGVALALHPGGEGFGWPALIAFAGSLFFAMMMVITRLLRATSDTAMVVWQTAAAGLGGLLFLPLGWATPSLIDTALMALLGIVAMLAHMAVNRSLILAPASVVVPYQYTLIVWAVLLGWLVFSDVPGWTTLAGAAVIIGAGAWIFWDERRG